MSSSQQWRRTMMINIRTKARRRHWRNVLRLCLICVCVSWNLVALLVVTEPWWESVGLSFSNWSTSTAWSVNKPENPNYHHPGKLLVQLQAMEKKVETVIGEKDHVIQILLDAGVTESFLQQHASELPTWQDIVEQYGDRPIIWGLDSCSVFCERVPAVQRMLGAAGMFSTGTNLVTQLLKHNCYIPERVAEYGISATKEQHGMRWQVPWGKHTPAHFREQHSTTHAKDIRKDDILPVITLRHPYRWMRSMCKNPYTARWSHDKQCPNLNGNTTTTKWNPVSVKYGAATESYQSLAHLWNDWYNDYYQTNNNTTSYPRLIIRMEDLIFHTKATIQQVCHCVGGRLHTDENPQMKFQYITDSAKADSPGHDTSTGMAEAWIKYSRPLSSLAGMAPNDYQAAVEVLDPHLMQLFGYRHPPPAVADGEV